jgi:superfamily II DNA/RNA helicase
MRASLRDRRKVLVFSYFADTAEWVQRRLAKAIKEDNRLACYKETDRNLSYQNQGIRLGMVSGGNDSELSAQKAAGGFAPVSSELESNDLYDIMVSTDVLAEGVNLQQARHIINYDLPWNPMRLVQRHGRVDRIGSKHPKVYLRSYFPDQRLDAMLQLQERISQKIAMAAASVGVTPPIIGEKGGEQNFAGDIKVIKDLEDGDPSIFENGGTAESSQTAEQYRQELRKAMKEKIVSEQALKDMPGKAGSIMAKGKWPGFFFLAKIRAKVNKKEIQRLYLRFVHTDGKFQPLTVQAEDGTITHRIETREATCLRLIECQPTQQRAEDQDAEDQAEVAWEIASEQILSNWLVETDSANLAPKLRRTNHEADEFLRANLQGAARTLSLDAENEARRIILSPWPRREEAMLRSWIAGEGDEFKGLSKLAHAEKLAGKVLDSGLKASTPAPTLPKIEKENIELVCWMGIKQN